ncbi:MAG: hypothetical protein GY810_07445 [Aureispira sp.]|nr:hypothetical protein [Aureispira sp.]
MGTKISLPVIISKDGEYKDRYYLRLKIEAAWILFPLTWDQINEGISMLKEEIDNFV